MFFLQIVTGPDVVLEPVPVLLFLDLLGFLALLRVACLCGRSLSLLLSLLALLLLVLLGLPDVIFVRVVVGTLAGSSSDLLLGLLDFLLVRICLVPPLDFLLVLLALVLPLLVVNELFDLAVLHA